MNTRQTGNNYKIMKLSRYRAMCNLRGINNPFACSSLKSRLKRTLVAVWCGENHWRAKRWTFWLITRPAPNANFQIITVFSMAAVAVGYSVHYNQTNNENALLGYENERVERAKLAKYGFIRFLNISTIQIVTSLMAELSRAYVYECCGATKTSPRLNLLTTYVKERLFPSTKKHSNRVFWVIEFVS